MRKPRPETDAGKDGERETDEVLKRDAWHRAKVAGTGVPAPGIAARICVTGSGKAYLVGVDRRRRETMTLEAETRNSDGSVTLEGFDYSFWGPVTWTLAGVEPL